MLAANIILILAIIGAIVIAIVALEDEGVGPKIAVLFSFIVPAYGIYLCVIFCRPNLLEYLDNLEEGQKLYQEYERIKAEPGYLELFAENFHY